MGFQFLLYINNSDEKAQMHIIESGKMLKVENQILRRYSAGLD